MLEVHSLYEGSFSVDSSKKFVPFDSKIHRLEERPGAMLVDVHPFLIVGNEGLILCDTGLGFTDDAGNLLIHNNIRKLGFDPSDVKYVLMSHLHKDHTGGMVHFSDGVGRIAFPEAEYIVQRGEWEDAYSAISPSYKTDIFDVVQRSGNLVLVEGDGVVNQEISYVMNGGHTEYHQAFHIVTGGEHYFFGGDVLPEPEQIIHNYIAKYDFNGRDSKQRRQDYWDEGSVAGWIFLFYHARSFALGRAELKADGSYRLAPAQ